MPYHIPAHRRRKHILPSLEIPAVAKAAVESGKKLVAEGKQRVESHMAATKAHVDSVRASLPKPTMPARPTVTALPDRQKFVERPALRRIARRSKKRKMF